MVLICGVSHALVHDGVEDRVAEALDRGDGAFVGSVEGDSVDRHAGRAEEGDRCRLLRELRTTGQAELVFLCGQRVRGDLNELVVGNAVGADDEIIAFAGAFDAWFCVLLAGARELGNVEEMTRRAAIGGGLGGQYRGRRQQEKGGKRDTRHEIGGADRGAEVSRHGCARDEKSNPAAVNGTLCRHYRPSSPYSAEHRVPRHGRSRNRQYFKPSACRA